MAEEQFVIDVPLPDREPLTRSLVIGDTAAGKSAFINFLLELEDEDSAEVAVPGQFIAQTHDVGEYGEENILIDTPGLNDPHYNPETLHHQCLNIGMINATFLILKDAILTAGTLEAVAAYRRIFGQHLNLIIVYSRTVHSQLAISRRDPFATRVDLETRLGTQIMSIEYINTIQGHTPLDNFIKGEWAAENNTFKERIFKIIAQLQPFETAAFGLLPHIQRDLIDITSRLHRFLTVRLTVRVDNGVLVLQGRVNNVLGITTRVLTVMVFNLQIQGEVTTMQSVLNYLGHNAVGVEIAYIRTRNPLIGAKQIRMAIIVQSSRVLVFTSN